MGGEPIVWCTTQEIEFDPLDTQKANLLAIAPQFPQPSRSLWLGGTKLGEAPMALFPMAVAETVSLQAGLDEDDILIVGVPVGMVDGTIRVDDGQGSGNSHRAKVLFSPCFELGLIEPEQQALQPQTPADPTAFFRFEQDLAQFVLKSFSVELYDVDASLSALGVDSLVGSGVMRQVFNEEKSDLKVSEAGED